MCIYVFAGRYIVEVPWSNNFISDSPMASVFEIAYSDLKHCADEIYEKTDLPLPNSSASSAATAAAGTISATATTVNSSQNCLDVRVYSSGPYSSRPTWERSAFGYK